MGDLLWTEFLPGGGEVLPASFVLPIFKMG